jgi:superfamily II DNA/RNA helicase
MSDSRTFGEVFFEELNANEYLKKIYDDILFNYAIQVFGFKNRRKRSIPMSDALAFADLLSKSNHPRYSDAHRMWAQEIITMLHFVYPDDDRITYVAGSVLASIGNYQGQKIINSTFDGVDILDRYCGEFKKDFYAIPNEPGNYFMTAQKTIYDHLTDGSFSYSGPTSMGKSYIMRIFLKAQIIGGEKKNFAIVVPTKALINEVREKIVDDLKENLHAHNYHIVTAAGDASLKCDELDRNYIFIMTPERLLYLLINEKQIKLDFLFIDEAHKLSGSDKRSPFYYQFVHMLSEQEPAPHIIFASPNIPNPEIYLKLIADAADQSNKLATTFSPVSQVKFIVNLDDKEVSVYNEHTKTAIPITSVALPDADLTDVLLRFEKDETGKEKSFIVYFSSVRKTVTAARDFAANRNPKNNKELIDLSKDIRNDVHNDYYLADLISVGVAYHIGYLPASIRQRIEKLFKAGIITALFCTSTLVEGVNLPADNLFITDIKNGLKNMKAVDFRNLIGRVGRLEFNLYGNVFLVASSDKVNEKYEQLLKEEIAPQTLSVEKGLTKPQKKNVIDALLSGTVQLAKHPDNQSADSYDLMRKFAIILLNDILKDRNSLVRKEFSALMQPGDEEKIRELFSNTGNVVQDDDITVSVDQAESLYQAIANNGLEFPAIDAQGNFVYDELTAFLERLCRIFKWEIYESDTLGHVGRYSNAHGRLHWYQVILSQWVRGSGLQTIIYQAIRNKEQNPANAMYIDRQYCDYTGSVEHKNIIISEVLDVIDEIILFKLSNYFLKVSKAYKEIRQVDKVPNDWYEFVEYGSVNKETINIQKNGFSRESAIYILAHPEYIAQTDPELKLHKSVLACPSRGVRDDAALIQYNIPDLFVE